MFWQWEQASASSKSQSDNNSEVEHLEILFTILCIIATTCTHVQQGCLSNVLKKIFPLNWVCIVLCSYSLIKSIADRIRQQDHGVWRRTCLLSRTPPSPPGIICSLPRKPVWNNLLHLEIHHHMMCTQKRAEGYCTSLQYICRWLWLLVWLWQEIQEVESWDET